MLWKVLCFILLIQVFLFAISFIQVSFSYLFPKISKSFATYGCCYPVILLLAFLQSLLNTMKKAIIIVPSIFILQNSNMTFQIQIDNQLDHYLQLPCQNQTFTMLTKLIIFEMSSLKNKIQIFLRRTLPFVLFFVILC